MHYPLIDIVVDVAVVVAVEVCGILVGDMRKEGESWVMQIIGWGRP